MKKDWRIMIMVIFLLVFSGNRAFGESNCIKQSDENYHADSNDTSIIIKTNQEKDSIQSICEAKEMSMAKLISAGDKVVVGKDTVDMVIKEKNYGRYDRGLFNYLFIPKGQWSFGISVSYGSLSSENLSILSLISDLDVDASIFSIKPHISYFVKNNSCVGMKLGYNSSHVDLKSFGMSFGDDIDFNLKNVYFHYDNYNASVFFRNYIGLGRDKRFGVFNEVDLYFGSGNSQFKRYYNNELRDTKTVTTECKLNFSPGLCVFMQDNVSFNVSFGIFGLYFLKEKQKTNDVNEGTRYTSGADFKFNLFNINLGIAVHI